MNRGGDCWTAPATPGLLNICLSHFQHFWFVKRLISVLWNLLSGEKTPISISSCRELWRVNRPWQNCPGRQSCKEEAGCKDLEVTSWMLGALCEELEERALSEKLEEKIWRWRYGGEELEVRSWAKPLYQARESSLVPLCLHPVQFMHKT